MAIRLSLRVSYFCSQDIIDVFGIKKGFLDNRVAPPRSKYVTQANGTPTTPETEGGRKRKAPEQAKEKEDEVSKKRKISEEKGKEKERDKGKEKVNDKRKDKVAEANGPGTKRKRDEAPPPTKAGEKGKEKGKEDTEAAARAKGKAAQSEKEGDKRTSTTTTTTTTSAPPAKTPGVVSNGPTGKKLQLVIEVKKEPGVPVDAESASDSGSEESDSEGSSEDFSDGSS